MREGGFIGDIRPLLPELQRLFQEHRVTLAYLFGSQASGKAGPLSDVDIAVLFAEDLDSRTRFRLRCHLIAELMGVFRRNDVEVVDLAEASPLLRNQVRRYGQLLYCPDDRQRVRFQTEALRDYLDTRPIRQVQQYYLIKKVQEGTYGGRRDGNGPPESPGPVCG